MYCNGLTAEYRVLRLLAAWSECSEPDAYIINQTTFNTS
jgi:hypothetical protein